MGPGEDTVLAIRGDRLHGYLRKRMLVGYTGEERTTLEPDIDQRVLDHVDLIERKHASNAENLFPMDLARKLQFFTSDIMSKLSFDVKFNLQDDNDNLSYIHEVETPPQDILHLHSINSSGPLHESWSTEAVWAINQRAIRYGEGDRSQT